MSQQRVRSMRAAEPTVTDRGLPPLDASIATSSASAVLLENDDVNARYNVDGVITMPTSAATIPSDGDSDGGDHTSHGKRKASHYSAPASSSSQSSSHLSHCWSTVLRMSGVTETSALLSRRYRSTLSTYTARDAGLFLLFFLSYATLNSMMFFGQNFWLNSFKAKPGAKATYASLVFPSLTWAAMNLLLIVPYTCWYKPHVGLVSFWRRSKEGVALLVAIGTADAIAGLTSVYATPHIPTLMQTTFYASGTIWVYIMHSIFYRKTAVPFSFPLLVSFLFLLGGIALSVVPVVVLNGASDLSANPGWIGIYTMSIFLPAFYNVCQGRFLRKFSAPRAQPTPADKDGDTDAKAPLLGGGNGNGSDDHNGEPSIQVVAATDAPASARGDDEEKALGPRGDVGADEEKVPHEACKLVVLTVDYWLQAIITLFFLPLDALPWFGASGSISDAWDGFIAACHCIWWECTFASPTSADPPGEEEGPAYNFYYMLLYMVGFWGMRALMTFMNVYSPTAGALIAQMTTPITSLMLVLCPSWNVYGKRVHVGYTVGCFAVLAVAAFLFIAVNEANVQRLIEKREGEDKKGDTAETATGGDGCGVAGYDDIGHDDDASLRTRESPRRVQ